MRRHRYRVLSEVIEASYGASWMFKDRVPMMIREMGRTTAAIDIMRKDLTLVTGFAASLGASVPQAEQAREVFANASANGLGSHNDSDVVRLLRR